ncbi:ABC transporter substrate-binding protein [Ethanoligenens harbinense]|uniref:Extracellular solute-binding protein family 1 n=1 Tax=Ethanoligenens harbinense (strain DSM 18485 / JCM 12961 / CGMCC 1.5033 / YUAN-3) TaxID=663278 RepID=E6U9M2_ETHHY|nr:extracellular solute-binding protein [Ethanoligenens harbinense]ADU27308.1 extracellular solute-binding protein family 1 [Ethanoligenens harbinense YUAN-3]AVQ96373.1 sugar ABC transporter substrate-binding protein [Ethanoligenens harbinense YUAN-3]AYF39031.1 sugar ABC transporter substrate-binding protein [Ethanoligenens harbinense]AYF41857.1 sugar ABC transporter substrate-binding protein [Ethanoligenens harbinense]QCN92614.1 extracellular solute-binding protein [Ethanoligenens harbinense]
MKNDLNRMLSMVLCAGLILGTVIFSVGCQSTSGKVTVELFQYKPEAVKTFQAIAKKFNAENPDINLIVTSPNDAITILKTRLIKNDLPDIIGIGGDINYSNFLDADMLLNISDYKGLDTIKDAYKEMDKQLELVPKEGVYAVPYAANASGILYNKQIFQQHGWTIPTTWDELIALCEKIKAAGITPFYFGMKDTWTTLAPWNAIAVDLVSPDICQHVNMGRATFQQAYSEVADKEKALLQYGQKDPFAYGYNDACTAFAKGQSAMFAIGSYAVPQITSVNPNLQLDSFVMPASNNAAQNKLNSGNDLQFSVMKSTKHKAACYRVLDFLLKDKTVQSYVDEQNAVPCKEGDFKMSSVLDSMQPYIKQGKMADYQDHHYPSEMSVDALIQTFLLGQSKEAFLSGFDKDWKRYNQDTIAKLQAYEAEHGAAASSSAS